MKETLKKALIKSSYIIFALLVSVALWMFVEITENRLLTRDISFREDQIIRKNSELLSSRELLVSSIITEDLTLTFEGTRAEISSLASVAGDVMLEIDLGEITSAGTWSLSYEVILPESLNNTALSVLSTSSPNIVAVIDRLLRRDFPIDVIYTGGVGSDELVALLPEVDPQVITISGPEEFVSQIAHVDVPIVAANLTSTYSDDLGFRLLNEDGEDLNTELHISDVLTFSHDNVRIDSIRVTIPVKQRRELPLSVLFSHGVTTNDSNVTATIEPATITVQGEPGSLEMNSIVIGTIDTRSFGLVTAPPRTFPIILPDGVTSVSGESEAQVTVEAHNLSVELRSVSNLQAEPEGLAVVITQTVDVRIRGIPEEIEQVTADNILIVADVTDMSPGTQQVNARAQLIGTNAVVDIIGDFRVYVEITS